MPSPVNQSKARTPAAHNSAGVAHRPRSIFYGWIIVAVCVLARGAKSWGQANVLLFVLPSISEDLDLSSEAMAYIFLAATLSGAVAQIPMGKLVDRAGARKCMTAGLLLLATGMLYFTTIKGPIGLFVGFFTLRASFAIDLFVDQCLSQWFTEMRGRALAVSNIGAQILGVVIASELAEIWTEIWGWRTCYVLASSSCFFIAIPVLAFIRSNPTVMGLLPDGEQLISSTDDTNDSDAICSNTPDNGVVGVSTDVVVTCGEAAKQKHDNAEKVKQDSMPVKPSSTVSWTCSEAFSTFPAWAFLIHGLVDGWIGAETTFHRLDILSGEASGGVSAVPFDVAAWVNSPGAMTNVATVICVGILIDKGVEPPRLLLCSLLANILSIVAVTAHHPITAPQGLVHGLLQGVNWGISNTVKAAAYASYFGPDHIGSILGIDKFANIAGTAIGPAALASLRGRMGSLDSALRLSVVLPCLVFILMCFAKRPRKRGYGSVAGKS